MVWPRPVPKLCACGCGNYATAGRAYISGHNCKGRPCSNETRRKISESHRSTYNETPYGWDSDLHRFLPEYKFRLIRMAVLRRDNYACVCCSKNADSASAAVHHVAPLVIGKSSKFCDKKSNLVAVCKHCHRRIHGNVRKPSNDWKEFLPFAKDYLSKFGYSVLLLDRYMGD